MGLLVRQILAFASFLYGAGATAAFLHCALVALMHKNKRAALQLFIGSVVCAIIFGAATLGLLP